MKKIYAYDFFDTIVHRDCHPEKILFQWSKNMSLFLKFIISPSDLYQIRKEAEKRLKASNDIEEPLYEDLIKSIYDRLRSLQNVDTSVEEFLDYSYSQEFEIERSHLYLDECCTQEIIKHKMNGDTIVLISDFYLGKCFIQEILKELKFEGFFTEMFVSSDLNRRKATGKLYKYVLEYLKIQPEAMFMQGDNYKSDVIMPQQFGICAKWRRYDNPYHEMSDGNLKRKVKEILFSGGEENALSGYAGEMAYFVSELYRRLCRNGDKKVLFCSREGQLLKKMFDIYQIKVWGKKVIESKYFYVSRRATILPSLDEFDCEEFKMIFRQFKKLKVKDFLQSIGFLDNEMEFVCKEIEVSMDSEISIDKENSVYIKLLNNSIFLNMYNKKRHDQKAAFYKYLHELGYSLTNEKIVIVDIGWKGTIQDCIQRALPRDCVVEGYYFGLRTEEFGCMNEERKHGILFSDYPQKCENYGIFEYNYMFYERIFAADHGPVIGYCVKDEKIVPIINNKEEEVMLYNYMKPFQANLLSAFEKVLEQFSNSCWEAYERYDLMTKNFLWKQCVYFPKIWKIEKNARNKSRENFGDISKNEEKRSKKISIKQIKKAEFFFVDYSFRLLEKCHLGGLSALAEIYCRLVYLIKLAGVM